MTYSDAHNFLLSLHNIDREQYHADRKNCDWYLKRMQFFLDLLGNPEKKIPHYIHVTGTSGKGSVCLMLDAILRGAGKKVGTLTSPHPSEILERWEVNGKPMNKKEFVAMVEEIKPIFEKCLATTPYDSPSFSELMTACGLYYFAKKKVEWAVMEVACGGRYDATNIIPRKDAAVITNIGLDHTEILGNTREKIAYEKVGIIKKGCDVFTQERNKKVLGIIQRECWKQKAFFEMSNDKCQMINENAHDQFSNSFFYKDAKYHLPVLGRHQVKNAVLCIDIAESLGIPTRVIQKGLGRVVLPIRMEVISKKPLIILDGAHNKDKMKTTIDTIKALRNYNVTPVKGRKTSSTGQAMKQWNNVHLVVGYAANKDISTMIKQLAKLKPKTIACTRFTSNIFRKSADPRTLADQFKTLLPRATIKLFIDPEAALQWSKRSQKTGDVLLVTGSIFLSGQLRSSFSPA